MTKILMVCLGNICRSPLAEGIMRSKLPLESFMVDSAGTAAYHVGNTPDYRSVEVAEKYGINIKYQKARQFSNEDFRSFDIIYAMDQSNYENILTLADSEKDKRKVKLILDENSNVSLKNIPDPYYGSLKDFEAVFELLNETCETISKQLLN